ATRSGPPSSTRIGSIATTPSSRRWLKPSTRNGGSVTCPSSPTPWRMRAVTCPTSSPTCVLPAPTSVPVGPWTSSSARGEAVADGEAMVTFLRESGKLTERKARLFAAACCRGVWELLADRRGREAVEAAEGYADGVLPRSSLTTAFRASKSLRGDLAALRLV